MALIFLSMLGKVSSVDQSQPAVLSCTETRESLLLRGIKVVLVGRWWCGYMTPCSSKALFK